MNNPASTSESRKPADTAAAVVVAVDGTSGSGKSSTSRGVAARLGLRYLDTGAMYRAVTLWMLEHEIDVHDADAVAKYASEPVIVSGTDPTAPTITLDGVDVSAEIRTDVVNANVSAVSAVPQVRERLKLIQRAIITEALADRGVVVEGRDIGSVVWPDAELKIFLTADPAARAARRALEEGGTDAARVRASLEARDKIDSSRAASPLVQADGAVELDTTAYTLDEVIDQLAALVESVKAAT